MAILDPTTNTITLTDKERFQSEYDVFGVKKSVMSPLINNPTGLETAIPNAATTPASPTSAIDGQSTGEQSLVEGLIQSSNFVSGSSGWRIDSDGNVEFNNGTFRGTVTADELIIGGGLEITVSPGSDIQAALDAIDVVGGGTLRVSPGIYSLTTDLILPSNTMITGISSENCIWDFGGTAHSVIAAGTDVYTTGTIFSITGNINVTGSGTAWLANAHAGQCMFLGTRWYLIGAVLTDTTLTLAEPYADDLTMPGLAYRISTIKRGIWFYKLTIRNSTATLLSITDSRYTWFQDLVLLMGNKGIVFNNHSNCTLDDTYCELCTSNGAEYNNVSLMRVNANVSFGNGGHGIVENNTRALPFSNSSSQSNIGDGWNLTNAVGGPHGPIEGSNNGGNGIQLVSGCQRVYIYSSEFKSNGVDGVRLTATATYNTVGPISVRNNTGHGINLVATSDSNIINVPTTFTNGGYGIEIGNANCDLNHVISPVYVTNVSGTINDLGTGTVII